MTADVVTNESVHQALELIRRSDAEVSLSAKLYLHVMVGHASGYPPSMGALLTLTSQSDALKARVMQLLHDAGCVEYQANSVAPGLGEQTLTPLGEAVYSRI